MINKIFTALEGFIFIAISISAIIMIFNIPISLGIIWASLFGLIFGSYSTSFVARIPKRIMMKKSDPFCMNCKNHLERRDLYTIFSYIINKGKCRFCNTAIPKAIFFTETTVTIAYIIAYLQYGFSLEYVIMSFIYFFSIIFISIWINDRHISYIIAAIVLLLVLTSEASSNQIFF